MKIAINLPGHGQKRLEKTFQIPSDYLSEAISIKTVNSWRHSHRKNVQINAVAKGRDLCFVWKTLS
ncbi:MAG: hypothetical protein HY547_08275 [Elusimicrobia bacterium]|nr:hypothetical protein [Elusimicrobiota bacterium]